MRAAALALALLALAAPTSPQAPPFTVDHAIEMTSVGSPQISPDGRHVLFTRSELDWKDNERDSHLWIAGVDGGDARPFTAEEGDGSARWSPDGRWIAFTRAARDQEDGGPGGEGRQLWLIRTDGGEARQLTRHATAVRRYEWAPDSRRIVLLADDTLSKADRDARKEGDDAVFVNEGPNGQTRGSYSNLWWVPVTFDSAEARPVTTGNRLIGDFAVSPDGGRVAFTFRTENHRNDSHRSEIAIVGIDGGEIRTLTANEAPESGLAWTPDGRALLFTAPSLETWELDQGNRYIMTVADGSTRQLIPESTLDIRDEAFTPDGRFLDFVALDRTVSSFYRLDLRNGRVRKLSDWDGTVGSATWSRDHAVVAFTHETPTSPGEVYTARFGDRMTRTAITDAHAAIRTLALSSPETVTWTSQDGTEIEGLLYRPPGNPRAAGSFVLEIHGGPAGVFTRGFDADAQLLTAQGYAVLQPNVRGSSGYGDALLRANMNDIGGGDFHDLMTGVDAMIRRGVAHPDSLAVKGWSYGGILGGWTITRTDRFRAASLGAMVADWASEFGVGFNYDVSRWYLGGDPWSNAELWRERSAYTHADRVKTPTILFHGDQDATDTMGQSMNFHVALRHHGVPTRFIRFPREGHGISEPRHHRTRLVEELRWFEHWVRGNEQWVAPERPGGAEKPVT
ncbi:MAG TPA: S9 family peptidase [Longimicrobiales bacterium]|nr:S9 family peptidase [Longimicrobiales bacterium]